MESGGLVEVIRPARRSMMRRVRVFDWFTILIEVEVITVRTFEGPEENTDDHDQSAEDRQTEFEVDSRRRIGIEPAGSVCSNQDSETRNERIDRLMRHVNATVFILGFGVLRLFLEISA